MNRHPHGRDSFPGGASHPSGLSSGVCTAVIGSMTQAMKAQSILAEAAIRATLVKVSSAKATGGCAYGVDFPCTQSANVRTVLERTGVRVREYLQSEG